jgi:filamentous hemagglutinin
MTNNLDQTTAISSLFSGDSVTLTAGRDLTLTGSDVVAQHDLTAFSGQDLVIEAARETHAETHYRKSKKSGVFGSGGIGFTIGSQKLSTDLQTETVTAAPSTLGSVEGDVRNRLISRASEPPAHAPDAPLPSPPSAPTSLPSRA